MNQEERMEAIVQYLIDHPSIRIEDICDMFQVSKDTARRDLIRLEENDQIIRTRGGATRSQLVRDIQSYNVRLDNLTENHKRIGQVAASMIHTGDRIILDASTTVQTCAAAMKHKECTVVTNSIHQADLLASYSSVSIHLIGGNLHKSHRYMYGTESCQSIARYFVDKVFLGVVGISENGLTVAHDEDASLKKQMIKQAEETYVLADNSKFGKNDFVKIADLHEIDYIITDEKVDNNLLTILKEQGVEVIVIS